MKRRGTDPFLVSFEEHGFVSFDEIERVLQERIGKDPKIAIFTFESELFELIGDGRREERCPGCGVWGYVTPGRSRPRIHAECGASWVGVSKPSIRSHIIGAWRRLLRY